MTNHDSQEIFHAVVKTLERADGSFDGGIRSLITQIQKEHGDTYPFNKASILQKRMQVLGQLGAIRLRRQNDHPQYGSIVRIDLIDKTLARVPAGGLRSAYKKPEQTTTSPKKKKANPKKPQRSISTRKNARERRADRRLAVLRAIVSIFSAQQAHGNTSLIIKGLNNIKERPEIKKLSLPKSTLADTLRFLSTKGLIQLSYSQRVRGIKYRLITPGHNHTVQSLLEALEADRSEYESPGAMKAKTSTELPDQPEMQPNSDEPTASGVAEAEIETPSDEQPAAKPTPEASDFDFETILKDMEESITELTAVRDNLTSAAPQNDEAIAACQKQHEIADAELKKWEQAETILKRVPERARSPKFADTLVRTAQRIEQKRACYDEIDVTLSAATASAQTAEEALAEKKAALQADIDATREAMQELRDLQ